MIRACNYEEEAPRVDDARCAGRDDKRELLNPRTGVHCGRAPV